MMQKQPGFAQPVNLFHTLVVHFNDLVPLGDMLAHCKSTQHGLVHLRAQLPLKRLNLQAERIH